MQRLRGVVIAVEMITLVIVMEERKQAALRNQDDIAKSRKRKAEAVEQNAVKAFNLNSSDMDDADRAMELYFITLIRRKLIEKARRQTNSVATSTHASRSTNIGLSMHRKTQEARPDNRTLVQTQNNSSMAMLNNATMIPVSRLACTTKTCF